MAIVLAGAFGALWSAKQSNRYMRENLLFQSRQAALAVDPGRIMALSGSDADLADVDYLRLKEQLAGTRKATPGCKFIYLMGRREDATVFFFADSEPVGSENESPAGQIYEDISDEDLRVFEEKIDLTSGPSSDRRGTWISALVPLTDPDTGSLIAVAGLDFAASEWQQKQLRAALPPLLLAMTMAALLAVGVIHINRSAASADQSQHNRLFREKILAIIAIGSFLSLSAAWMTNGQTIHARHQAFRQLAQDKAIARQSFRFSVQSFRQTGPPGCSGSRWPISSRKSFCERRFLPMRFSWSFTAAEAERLSSPWPFHGPKRLHGIPGCPWYARSSHSARYSW